MPHVFRRKLRFVLLAALCGLIFPPASRAQVIVKVSDTIFFRLGTLIQFWADGNQDPISGGYSQNSFLRRMRLIAVGQIAPNVAFFFLIDNPRLGNAGTGTGTPTKSLSTGLLVLDAFGEWRIAGDSLMLDAGLFLLPHSRNNLTGASSILAFDVSNFSVQQNTATQGSGGRDVGFALKGYLINDHLEYRAGVFAGQRLPQTALGAGSRNSPRFAARLQYDVFDTEKGYVYVGTNRGTKRILAIGVWGDTQGDYRAAGGDVTADLPIVGKDTLTVDAEYFFYDGRQQFVAISVLPKEHATFTDVGYYLDAVKLQPFLRYERLDFDDATFEFRGQQRYGGGVNWYVAANNFKISALYERIVPRVRATGASLKDTNHFAVQFQFFYF